MLQTKDKEAQEDILLMVTRLASQPARAICLALPLPLKLNPSEGVG